MTLVAVLLLLSGGPALAGGPGRASSLKKFEPDGIAALAFSPTGKVLATAGVDEFVRLWDVGREKELRSTRAHVGGVVAVAFSADGRLVISAGADGVIRLWDGETLKQRGELRGHEKEVTCLALAPDGKTLASGSLDKTVRVWDLGEKKEVRKFTAHGSGVQGLAFTADGKALVSSGDVTTVIKDVNTFVITHPDKPRLWNPASGQLLRAYDVPGGVVALSPDQRVLAAMALLTEYQGNVLRQSWHFSLLDGFSGRPLGKVDLSCSGMTFSPDGKLLALVNTYGSLLLWEVATGKVAYERPKYSGRLVAFSPDGKRLAVAVSSSDKGIPGAPASPRLRFLELPPDRAERARRAEHLDGKALEQLWDDLVSADAKKGLQAVWMLAAAPQKALPLLADRLKAAAGVEVRRFHKLLAALDSGRFAEREAASAALEKLGPLVAPALQDLLASDKPSPETRKRVQAVLARMSPWIPRAGEALRHGRAVQVLELIGTPEAQAILTRLAADQETISQLAHDARRALARLRTKGA
jgi:dipeptidyl aminopeptidase/acylaminoacyl peptidase